MVDSIFFNRRQQLMQQLAPNSIALLKTAPELRKSHDINFDYRTDPDFLYLTGYEYPDAIAIIIPKRLEGDFILFIREIDEKDHFRTGRGVTKQQAIEHYGAKQVYPMDLFVDMLPDLLDGHAHVYYSENSLNDLSTRILSAMDQLKKRMRTGTHPPSDLINLNKLIHEMRLIKSKEEIALLKQVAEISAKGHVRAMKNCKPKMHEYELRAEVIYEFYKHGASDEAFHTIVAGDHNACILHYDKNDQLLKGNILVLIDAGAEYKHYSSDISRTFPVNGHFTANQRKLYEIVLHAQLSVIESIKPGVSIQDLQELAIYQLADGLIKLGILSGPIASAITSNAYKRFFMHHVSHWVGMNVHDESAYKIDGQWRMLKPNMVLTVEPGLYIPNDRDIDIKWRGIGIRIEDVILVTDKGHEVLTHHAPKNPNDIEALMRGETLIEE